MFEGKELNAEQAKSPEQKAAEEVMHYLTQLGGMPDVTDEPDQLKELLSQIGKSKTPEQVVQLAREIMGSRSEYQ